MAEDRVWHMLEVSRVYAYFKVRPEAGLSWAEARRRWKRVGENTITQKKRIKPLPILLSQFKDFMIIALLGATVISALLGEVADAITIAAIVILNAVLGFVQEYRAEKSLEALKELSAPIARVIRETRLAEIPACELVPGDVIVLEAGDRVSADARLWEAFRFQSDESILTGESSPVTKTCQPIRERKDNPGDQKNMVFMGTNITGGRGKAVVVATGMQTEVGKIARMMQTIGSEPTPLQKRLEHLGQWLVAACLGICALVSAAGILRGEPVYTMFMSGVSLAVAAIPEGLPAIVTLALAIGVQRMVKRRALIRKLPAVETLGCATVICSDKTGTLTENKMTVRSIFVDGREITVTGSGYQPEGEFFEQGQRLTVQPDPVLQWLLQACVWCNNAQLQMEKAETPGRGKNLLKLITRPSVQWTMQGDPTEGALLAVALKAGLEPAQLHGEQPRQYELPFDSDRKRMSVVCRNQKGVNHLYLKGAVEVVLERCCQIQGSTRVTGLDQAAKAGILQANKRMAATGLRVLAVAYRRLPVFNGQGEEAQLEKDLIFLGLVGMVDPPRMEVKTAIDLCHRAGIKTVMVTGDHYDTAVAIARELDLLPEGATALSGEEMDALNDRELEQKVGRVGVYARVSPRHKLRIVKALKKTGQIVAMTGDGVNDAPAIKEADIGVAMGRSGTDVTKEAASMILLDDNFATLVAAVEEGRGIYANIRKFIRYLLSCNVGEVLTMFLATCFGLPLPLMPIQILWVNLVTDGLPALALGLDPADRDTMYQPPRPVSESIFAGGLVRKILVRGIIIGLSTVGVFAGALVFSGGDLAKARTFALATIVMCQLLHVFDCRSERLSVFEINWLTNLSLMAAVLISIGMLLLVIYVPFLQGIFETVALSPIDWLIVMVLAGFGSLIIGLRRLLRYRRRLRVD